MSAMLRLVLLAAITLPTAAFAAESVCYGTPSTGRLEDGVQLPAEGSSFHPYSDLGVSLGRTYVHSKVERVIVDAYAALAKSMPQKTFMYGESGWAKGGRIRPHRTHENGLALDFMVPVVDLSGRSVLLPTSVFNKFGYGIDFDTNARYENLVIDFEAIAEHLYAVHEAAEKNGIGISRVIFEPALIPKLYATKRGAFIKQNISFMQGKAWVRHDEHHHIDFSIACKPLS